MDKQKRLDFLIKGIKESIERYKRRVNNSPGRHPLELEAYSVMMYDQMELLADSAKIEQKPD